MLRTLAIVLAVAGAGTWASTSLFGLRASWAAPLAILVAGGALIAIAAVLRNAPRTPLVRRARGALPSDPGFPRPPQGAPYRGPY